MGPIAVQIREIIVIALALPTRLLLHVGMTALAEAPAPIPIRGVVSQLPTRMEAETNAAPIPIPLLRLGTVTTEGATDRVTLACRGITVLMSAIPILVNQIGGRVETGVILHGVAGEDAPTRRLRLLC